MAKIELEDMSVPQLKKEADKLKVLYKSKTKKADLIKAIKKVSQPVGEEVGKEEEEVEEEKDGHVVTDQDLDENPAWKEQGIKVGDKVEIDEFDGDEEKDGVEVEEASNISVEGSEEIKGKQVDILEGEISEGGNYRGCRYIRTYSEEVHGKDFLKLAKGFAEKESAKSPRHLVKIGVVSELEVAHRERSEKLGIMHDVVKRFEGKGFKQAALKYAAQVPQQASVVVVA